MGPHRQLQVQPAALHQHLARGVERDVELDRRPGVAAARSPGRGRRGLLISTTSSCTTPDGVGGLGEISARSTRSLPASLMRPSAARVTVSGPERSRWPRPGSAAGTGAGSRVKLESPPRARSTRPWPVIAPPWPSSALKVWITATSCVKSTATAHVAQLQVPCARPRRCLLKRWPRPRPKAAASVPPIVPWARSCPVRLSSPSDEQVPVGPRLALDGEASRDRLGSGRSRGAGARPRPTTGSSTSAVGRFRPWCPGPRRRAAAGRRRASRASSAFRRAGLRRVAVARRWCRRLSSAPVQSVRARSRAQGRRVHLAGQPGLKAAMSSPAAFALGVEAVARLARRAVRRPPPTTMSAFSVRTSGRQAHGQRRGVR